MSVGILWTHGGFMENKEFGILTEVLRIIGSGSKKDSLESTISSIITDYTPYLSEEQKNVVMREFMHYAKSEQKKFSPLFEKRLEEDKYRELLNSFFGSRDVVGF